MKVLHVMTGLDYGGAETHLSLSLEHTRHAAEVVGLYDPGFTFHQLKRAGFKVTDLDMANNRQISALLHLARVIKDGSYDVVHAHLFRAQIYARLAARLVRVPVIVSTEHSIGDSQIEGRAKTPATRFLYRATERMSDCTIAVSHRVRERLIAWGLDAARIVTIPIGIDLERYRFDPDAREVARRAFGFNRDQLIVGTVGRLVPIKRLDLLIHAAHSVVADGAKLLIVGDGPEEDRLRKIVHRSGLTPSVTFAGKQEDIPAMLAAMDLFVMTSAEETYGLAAVEALAAGLPVVATTCPAVERADIDRFFWTTANPDHIRSAIMRAKATLGHDRTRIPMRLDQFDVGRATALIDDLYETLWQARPRGTSSSGQG